MSVFWGEMKQGGSPLFIFYFGELPDEVPGVLCRHLSIIFPFKAGEIGSWHRYLIVRNTPYRLVPWAGVWYERKSLKRIGSSERTVLLRVQLWKTEPMPEMSASINGYGFGPLDGLIVDFVVGFWLVVCGGSIQWLAIVILNHIDNDGSYCQYEYDQSSI